MPAPEPPALALESVEASRGGFRLAVELAVAPGAHLSLIGPSGGGKSTLLDVIAGFLAPDRGRVLIGGADVTATAPARRPVTMLFQEHNLFPHLDAASNVGLGLSPSLRLSRDDRARVEATLAEVGLEGLGARLPAALSGGQRQRVALARALLREKPVLLLDEPFAALGPAQRAEMLALVRALRRDRAMAVVMVTHDPEDARRAGGEIAVVAEGRVAAPVPADELLAAPPPTLAAYLGGG